MTRLHLYVHAVSLDYTTHCYLYHNDVGDMIVLVLHLARSYLIIIINYCIRYSKSTEYVTVVFTPTVPVSFWPSWCIFGDILLKFCICCQLPSP